MEYTFKITHEEEREYLLAAFTQYYRKWENGERLS